jgi:hypothetical protein
MIYVYGSEKFAKAVRRTCGRVAVLEDAAAVFKLPPGAVLYTDLPLKAAAKMRLKAHWIAVRTGAAEIEDVQLEQLDVYGLLRDIERWGTRRVCVPDAAVRKALEKFSSHASLPISFEETCRPTYPCSSLWHRSYANHPASFLDSLFDNESFFDRGFADMETRGRPWR